MNDLKKMDEFKTTLPEKLSTYKQHIKTMKSDLQTYNNVGQVREDMISRKEKLEDRTRELHRM